ncbi:hypothetical protein Adt_23442 [Abeliophyllum distichum]|uniref:Uncharacterized protein n=1 Tax=Abeliophyllum distichum TaxID=126358 RepID=A0ABD1SAW5_9LAMI
MAPKRKDPLMKKGKEKAGSSFVPTPTVGNKCGCRRYPQISGSRERTNLQQVVNAEAYLGRKGGKPHLAYPLLVKEFLANFNHAIEEPATDHRYTTWVRGKWIKFSSAMIANYYGLTAHDFEPIPADFDMTQEPESPEPPITKRTLGNPIARQAADNPALIPAVETDRLLRQIFTQLSEQGRVLNSIQCTQLAMKRTVDQMRIEMDSLKESNNTLRGRQRNINFTYDDVNHRILQFAQRLDDIYTIVSQPSTPSTPHHGSAPDDPSDHQDLLLHIYPREVPDLFFLSFCSNLLTLGTM